MIGPPPLDPKMRNPSAYQVYQQHEVAGTQQPQGKNNNNNSNLNNNYITYEMNNDDTPPSIHNNNNDDNSNDNSNVDVDMHDDEGSDPNSQSQPATQSTRHSTSSRSHHSNMNIFNEPVLAGVTVVISKKIPMEKQTKLERLLSSLGAAYQYMYDSSVTHYIHEGMHIITTTNNNNINLNFLMCLFCIGKADSSKDYKAITKNNKVKIVSPLWIERCFEVYIIK